MVNYSDKGIYLETDIALDEETDLIVGIEDSKFTSQTASTDSPMFFRAKTLWQKDLKDSIFNFGYGSKIISVADNQKTLDTNSPVELELRKHPRKSCQKRIYFTWNDQYSIGTIDNISRGGVYIITKDNLTVGQTLSFVIPGTKYVKGEMLKGKVAYTSPKGVGIKIIGLLKGRKTITDRGGRRISTDRRNLFFSEYNPEKRSSEDRRISADRRSLKNLKSREDSDLSSVFRDID